MILPCPPVANYTYNQGPSLHETTLKYSIYNFFTLYTTIHILNLKTNSEIKKRTAKVYIHCFRKRQIMFWKKTTHSDSRK